MSRHTVGFVALALLAVASSAGAQPRAWTPLNAGPPAVEAPVGLCPGDPGLMYLATFGGGVLRSLDEGHSWQPANTGLTNLAVNAMAVDPQHCEIVYAATFGGGMFKTTDMARTWTPLTAPNAAVLWLTIDPVRPWIVYAGVNGGSAVLRTTDAGATWRTANAGLPAAAVWSVQVVRSQPDTVYIVTSSDGAFKSTDGGGTWKALPMSGVLWSLALDPRDERRLYVGTNGVGVYRSDDAGESFFPVGTVGDGRITSLAHDPTLAGVVYAGSAGGGVGVSRDYGQHFDDTAAGPRLTLALAVQDTGEVYASTGHDGVFRSTGYGAVWRTVAPDTLAAIGAQNVYSLAVDPRDGSRVVAATNDGGLLGTSDGGTTWRTMGTGFSSRSSRQITFDPANASTIYAGSFNGGGLNVSRDGGATWTARRVGPADAYVWATAVDRSTGAVFAGMAGDGLWRSVDGASTFTRLAESLITDVRSVAPDGQRLLVGGRAGVHRSTDGGATWTQPLTVFTYNVTVDPQNPSRVFAATQTGGVFRSRDGGASFTAINTGLTSLRTSRGNGVVIDPRNSDVLYVGTETGGVFKSTDGGDSWRPVSQGLDNLTVLALAIDPQNPSVLYAGGGSGVFKTTTAAEPR